jgi:hypothetical protein
MTGREGWTMSKMVVPDKPRSLLTELPTLITLATVLLACFSIIYDWSYFLLIDSRLFSFLTISDHITTFVSSIPHFLLLAVVGYYNV